MTKANDAARARVKDAERRARRKMRRLENKGIRTGSISPFETIDPSNTRKLNSYYNRLEKFISRQTRYVAGNDGTPIPYKDYRDFRRLERKWNKQHDKYWTDFAPKPFITSKGESETTMGMMSLISDVPGTPFRSIKTVKQTEASKLKGVPELKRRMKNMERELSPGYEQRRVKQLRKNMLRQVSQFNEPELTKKVRGLTNVQLQALKNRTDFVPMYYHYLISYSKMSGDSVADSMDHESQYDHLMLTIEQIKKMYPRKTGTTKRKHNRKKR